MTEAEWLASTDPQAMLHWNVANPASSQRASDRKLRLFACACCREVWHLLTDDAPCPHCNGSGRRQIAGLWDECGICVKGRINRSRHAVEVAEAYAEGRATEEELRLAHRDIMRWNREEWEASGGSEGASLTEEYGDTIWPMWLTYRDPEFRERLPEIVGNPLYAATQAALLRDIVGNPFRKVEVPTRECGTCKGRKVVRVFDTGDADFDYADCGDCGGKGHVPDQWAADPTVRALVRAAYSERVDVVTECERCEGRGMFWAFHGPDDNYDTEDCPDCAGTGRRVAAGRLSCERLAVLADALVDAGCPEEVPENVEVVGHHNCPRCGGPAPYRSGVHFENERLCHKCWISWEPGGTVRISRPIPNPLLQHLRSPGPHVLGCWAVDALNGRE